MTTLISPAIEQIYSKLKDTSNADRLSREVLDILRSLMIINDIQFLLNPDRNYHAYRYFFDLHWGHSPYNLLYVKDNEILELFHKHECSRNLATFTKTLDSPIIIKRVFGKTPDDWVAELKSVLFIS